MSFRLKLPSMKLAIFDLDSTLIKGDSDKLWGDYLVSLNKVDPIEYKRKNDNFFAQYDKGELDIHTYLQFALQPLALYQKKDLDSWRDDFVQRIIKPLVYQQGADLVKSYKVKGYSTMIITATNRFITEPIAKLFAIDHLMATQVEQVDGQYTGRYLGTPTFQQGKLTNLRDWLKQHPNHSLDRSTFFSDSHNDIPLMQVVAKAVAVHPDRTLEAEAKARNWPIIYFSS